METCGQCPGAVSADLLLGRGGKYCDKGKAMYLELGTCVSWSEALVHCQRGTAAPQAFAEARAISSVCSSSVVP